MTGAKPWGRWRPIESAPLDGTLVLIRQGGYYPCHARFENGRWKPTEYSAPQYPTHWSPLGDDWHNQDKTST